MSAPIYTTPATSTPIAVDSDDPNTTAPQDLRILQSPTGQDRTPSAMYVIPVAGTITVQLWGKGGPGGRWYKIGSTQACPADTLTYLPAIPPTGVALYLQVTANSTGTQYVAGFQGQR